MKQVQNVNKYSTEMWKKNLKYTHINSSHMAACIETEKEERNNIEQKIITSSTT